MFRHHYSGDALIEVLHTAQELFGFLSPPLQNDCAEATAAAEPGVGRGQLLPFLLPRGGANLHGVPGHGLLRDGRRLDRITYDDSVFVVQESRT